MTEAHDHAVALTYPGQGGSTPGLLDAVERKSKAVTQLLDRVRKAWYAETGDDVQDVALDARTDDSVNDDRGFARSQLAIFATSVALHELIGSTSAAPVIHVGHSLGEIAALTAAGAWSLEAGTGVVAARTMSLTAVPRGVGGMVAIAGRHTQVEHLLAALGDSHLVIAGHNSPDQVVVSGPVKALDRLQAGAAALEMTATRLRSEFPFHSPIMAPAVAAFETAVRQIGFGSPQQAVYSPVNGRFYEAGDDLAALLAQHLVTPFDFAATVGMLYGRGVRLFIECGARTALTVATRRTLLTAGTAEAAGAWKAIAADGPNQQVGAEAIEALAGVAVGANHSGSAAHADTPTTRPTGQRDDVHAALRAALVDLLPGQLTDALRAELRPMLSDELDAALRRSGADLPGGWGGSVGAATGSTGASAAPIGGPVGTQPPAPAPVEKQTVDPAASAPEVTLTPDAVLAQLVELYAGALEYPPEVLEADIQLEGDLGVDSVKQTELLARAAAHFALPIQPSEFVIGEYPTLGHIADLVLAANGARS